MPVVEYYRKQHQHRYAATDSPEMSQYTRLLLSPID